MANPTVPHVVGVSLDAQGVAYSQIAVTNFSNGNIQIISTNASKQAIFDCANFADGYSNGDIIGIENAGASFGGTTLTIDTTSDMQTTTLDCTASSTTNNINM